MSHDSIRDRIRDVAFTVTTPFEPDTRDFERDVHEENVRALERAGANVFMPCGNTGEYFSLTHTERVAVVEVTVEATADDSTVIGGAGGSSRTVRQLLTEYESVGVDAAMVMPPHHTYVHERGIQEYYRSIVDSTDLPVVLYKRGPELSEDTIGELAGIDNVVGVKYAVNDVKAFSKVVDRVDDDLVWINGIAERFAPSYAFEGAEGFTTGIGNFMPRPVLELQRALEAGGWDRAKSVRETLRPYEDLREEADSSGRFGSAKNVPAVKYGMELAGLYGGPPRDPLVELADEDRERAREYYERITAELETANLSD
jgi:4-hydroxy-tetrahydrodipicolinate synthase